MGAPITAIRTKCSLKETCHRDHMKTGQSVPGTDPVIKVGDRLYARYTVVGKSYSYLFSKVTRALPSGRFRIVYLDPQYDETTRTGGKGWNTIRISPGTTPQPQTRLIRADGGQTAGPIKGLQWRRYDEAAVLESYHDWSD